MTERVLLMVGRHGEAPQKPEGGSYDQLIPEAWVDAYQRTGAALEARVKELGLTQKKTFGLHSKKERTRDTQKTKLVRAFNMQPNQGKAPPQSREELAHYDFTQIDIGEHPNLIYPAVDMNMAIYADPNRGATVCIDYWLANPEATIHEGVPIEAYVNRIKRVKAPLKAGIKRLQEEKDLGLIDTHSGITEPMVIELIRSGGKLIGELSEIGGKFRFGDYAFLTMERRKSGLHAVELEFHGETYAVDLSNL